jgi:hypothetical protein
MGIPDYKARAISYEDLYLQEQARNTQIRDSWEKASRNELGGLQRQNLTSLMASLMINIEQISLPSSLCLNYH